MSDMPERFEGVTVPDFRNTIIGCASATCRFNIEANPERTCALKLIAIDQTGRCRMAEARPTSPQPNAGIQPSPDGKIHIKEGMKIPPGTKFTHPTVIGSGGHFEAGVWVE